MGSLAPMDEATRRLLNRSMAALADGERGAFDPAYRTLWPLLVKVIASISGDRMIAEDVAQQAMLKILARVSTFDRSKDALGWSMAIAVNEYRSYRRKLGNRAVDQGEWLMAAAPEDCGGPYTFMERRWYAAIGCGEPQGERDGVAPESSNPANLRSTPA